MKKRIFGALLTLVAVFAVSVVPGAVYAAGNAWNSDACREITDAAQKAAAGCTEDRQAPSVANNLLNVAISVTGIVAVVIIVFGGQRYIVSNGDPGKIVMAKHMIMYGIIGMIVAAVAFAIVNFVLTGVFS